MVEICFYTLLLFGLSFLSSTRMELEEAKIGLESSRSEAHQNSEELILAKSQLHVSDLQLKETEHRLLQVNQNR